MTLWPKIFLSLLSSRISFLPSFPLLPFPLVSFISMCQSFFFLISVFESYPRKSLLQLNIHVSQFAPKRDSAPLPHLKHVPSPVLDRSCQFFFRIQKHMKVTRVQSTSSFFGIGQETNFHNLKK